MLPKISKVTFGPLKRIHAFLLILILFAAIAPVETEVATLDGGKAHPPARAQEARSAAGPAAQPQAPAAQGAPAAQAPEQRAAEPSAPADGAARRLAPAAEAARRLAPAGAGERPPASAGADGQRAASPVAAAPALAAGRAEKPAEAGFQSALEAALGVKSSEFNTLEVTATGYYAGPESTGKSAGNPEYGITYSGVKVRRSQVSTIAADPKVLPLGSLLYIPGYGYGVVADTGSAIKGNKIDLYFETKQDVYKQWGKKKLKVLVLKQGGGKVTENMLDRWNQAFAGLTAPPAAM